MLPDNFVAGFATFPDLYHNARHDDRSGGINGVAVDIRSVFAMQTREATSERPVLLPEAKSISQSRQQIYEVNPLLSG